MSEFEQPAPDFTNQEIKEILLRHYGLIATVTMLVGERDQNVMVTADDGARYVMKIANVAENAAILTLQNDLFRHLASAAPDLSMALLHPALDGQDLVQIPTKVEQGFHLVRMMTYVDGILLADADRSQQQNFNIGQYLGGLSKALAGFGSPAAFRPGFLWSLDNAASVGRFANDIADAENRQLVERAFERYTSLVQPKLGQLRKSVLYQDANDNNIIMCPEDPDKVAAVIDFGDVAYGCTINELAIALAYMLMDVGDLYGTARAVITGYTARFPLLAEELEILFDLVAMRLVMSVCISSNRARDFPDNDYLTISQQPAFDLLRKLDSLNSDFLSCFARECGAFDAVESYPQVINWLNNNQQAFKSVVGFDIQCSSRILVPMTAGSPGTEFILDQQQYAEWLDAGMDRSGAKFALGAYMEDRSCYVMEQFNSVAGESRSVHLGIDLFTAAATTVHAPMDGVVVSVQNNDAALDYGPTVILQHQAGANGPVFYTLYGHLSLQTLDIVAAGQNINAGDIIGTLGDITVNGGWAPHLHFQIMTTMLGQHGNFNGACEPAVANVWRLITPDPNLVLGLAHESFNQDIVSPAELVKSRAEILGPSYSLSYDKPLKIVRGQGAYLFDHSGRQYLDCVNNICHVGHCHPRVVQAIADQASLLNTNTRYLHETILDYSDRLLATLPDHLEVVYFVCTGSEANELALRMAKVFTERRDIITLDWGYHGNTSALIDVSPYKFNRNGGKGKKDHIHIAELPEANSDKPLDHYLTSVQNCILSAQEHSSQEHSAGDGPAAMIAESISGCGGQVILPEGYLQKAFELVQAAGGVCIADEVQVGFGRTGKGMWSFAAQNAKPDIVTMGKPMGNGHPIAAVVTTRKIADAFANGMEYFNSFGGNPVSMAAASATLDVIESENLIEHANKVGTYMMSEFKVMARDFPQIMDVRGAGLFIGIELTGTLAADVVGYARDHAVLLSTDGPKNTVIKIKPPMVISLRDADRLTAVVRRALEKLLS